MTYDLYWMQRALDLAKRSGDDCPIACIITHNNHEIAAFHNQVEHLKDPIAHAEILSIRLASKHLNQNLAECVLYCTLEPCPMCHEAIKLAKIGRVVFGAFRSESISWKIDMVGGILKDDCSKLLTDFFINLRKIKH